MIRPMSAALLMLAGLLMAVGLAVAAPVPPGTIVKAPEWRVGSEWYYSDGYGVKVASVSAKGTVFDRIDAPGQWYMREGFIRTDSTDATEKRTAIYRTIPNSAGFSLSSSTPLTFEREYLADGKLMVHASSWTVEGRETITVPAGTFDCWVIVWRTRSLKSDWTGFERWWYSPQVQHYVRMEYKYGPGEPGSRVLMRYHLGPAAEVPVAANAAAPVTAAAAPAAPVVAPAPAPVEPVKKAEIVAPKSEPAPAPVVASQSAPAPAEPAKKAELPVAAAPAKQAEARTPAVPEKSDQAPAPVAVASAPEAKTSAPAVPPVQSAELPAPVQTAPAKQVAAVAEAKETDEAPAAMPQGGKSGAWHAQVGSSVDAAGIRRSLKKILAANPEAQDLPSGVTAREIEGRGTFYRAWVGSYESAKDARALCEALKAGRPGCAVFRGATVEARVD